MYEVERYMVPEGYKLNDYAKVLVEEIRKGEKVEENKDKLFRMTYPIMINYVSQFKNLYSEEYLVSDMAIAFMKTLDKFDPNAKNASFTNYYKLAAKTSIINSYYGKYKKDEESRKLKRDVDNLMASLEEKVSDKNGKESGTWHDLTPDDNFEIDANIMRECTHEDIYQAIDTIFESNGREKKKAGRAKEIYIDCINNVLFSRNLRQIDIAGQHGVSRAAVCRLIKRYDPLLKEELIRRGY